MYFGRAINRVRTKINVAEKNRLCYRGLSHVRDPKKYLQGGGGEREDGGRIAGIIGWVAVEMMGTVLGDGGVIVVSFNVSSDIIRFFERGCGGSDHDKIRIHVVAKDEGSVTSFAKQGNRARYPDQKFHDKTYNFCPRILKCRTF